MTKETYLTEEDAIEICLAYDTVYSESLGGGDGHILKWIFKQYPHIIKQYWWVKYFE